MQVSSFPAGFGALSCHISSPLVPGCFCKQVQGLSESAKAENSIVPISHSWIKISEEISRPFKSMALLPEELSSGVTCLVPLTVVVGGGGSDCWLVFVSGVWISRWDQVFEAGRLWIGNSGGRPFVHSLWHTNLCGPRNHCWNRVRFCWSWITLWHQREGT